MTVSLVLKLFAKAQKQILTTAFLAVAKFKEHVLLTKM